MCTWNLMMIKNWLCASKSDDGNLDLVKKKDS